MSAITPVSLGPNSVQLTYGAIETLTDVLNAFQSALPSLGWSVHDASAGTGAITFKALNADGVSYKFVRVVVDSGFIWLELYESWDALTHVGVNVAYNSGKAAYWG